MHTRTKERFFYLFLFCPVSITIRDNSKETSYAYECTRQFRGHRNPTNLRRNGSSTKRFNHQPRLVMLTHNTAQCPQPKSQIFKSGILILTTKQYGRVPDHKTRNCILYFLRTHKIYKWKNRFGRKASRNPHSFNSVYNTGL